MEEQINAMGCGETLKQWNWNYRTKGKFESHSHHYKVLTDKNLKNKYETQLNVIGHTYQGANKSLHQWKIAMLHFFYFVAIATGTQHCQNPIITLNVYH